MLLRLYKKTLLTCGVVQHPLPEAGGSDALEVFRMFTRCSCLITILSCFVVRYALACVRATSHTLALCEESILQRRKKAKKYKQLPGSRRLGCSGVVLIKKQVGSATLPLGIVLTVYFTTRQAQANMTPRLWGTPPPDYHYSQYCTT